MKNKGINYLILPLKESYERLENKKSPDFGQGFGVYILDYTFSLIRADLP